MKRNHDKSNYVWTKNNNNWKHEYFRFSEALAVRTRGPTEPEAKHKSDKKKAN